MTKEQKGADYSKVTPALADRVTKVIAAADRHTYSVSEVYAAHNAVFGLREQPQTCSSCLRNRVRNLRSWHKGYDEYINAGASTPEASTPEAPPVINESAEKRAIRYPMADGIPFDFLPNEGETAEGTVTRADGSKIRAGTYLTAGGLEIVVQPGGKARIKEEDLT